MKGSFFGKGVLRILIVLGGLVLLVGTILLVVLLLKREYGKPKSIMEPTAKPTMDHFEDYAPANLTPKDNEVVVALFSAGWCPHCQNYKPTWDKLKKSGDMKTSSGKTIRFVDVDCTKQAHPEAEKFKVEGYPTVVAISKSDNKHVSDRNTMEGIKGEVDSM